MKLPFVLFGIVMLLASSAASQQLPWSSPLEVPSGNNFGSTRPRVTVCNGVPVAVWSNGSSKQIWSSRLVNGTFSNPVLVTPPGFQAFSADWTGAEIDSKGDTLFVTFTDNFTPPGPAYVVRSIDGGLTFGDTVRVPLMSGELPRFPTVVAMPDGNPMVALMRFNASFGDPVNVVSLSNDGGNSFPMYTVATDIVPGSPCDCCPISVVANDDVTAVMFRNNDNNIRDTWAALSYDNANSFTVPARLDSVNWMLMSCPSSGPDGHIFGDTLVSVFMNGGGANGNKVYIASMDHNTMEIQSQKEIFMTMTNNNQNYPRIDGVGDTLGVVWKQQVAGLSEVMFAHSFNGPSGIGNWIDTLTSGVGGAQGYPDIAYGGGKLHVVFQNQATGKVNYMSAVLPQAPLSVLNAVSTKGFNVIQTSNSEVVVSTNVALNSSCTVRLYDAVGKLVMGEGASELIRTGSVTLNTGHLAGGTYLVVLQNGSARFTEKISIIR